MKEQKRSLERMNQMKQNVFSFLWKKYVLLFGIFFLVFLFQGNVFIKALSNSNVIYVPTGMGTDDLLAEEGEIKVRGEVSWDIPGIYPIEYYDSSQDTYITKSYHIVNEENFKQGVTLEEHTSTYPVSENKEPKQWISLSKNQYYLLGLVQMQNQTYGYIECYIDNECTYQYIEKSAPCLSITGCIDQDDLYICMTLQEKEFYTDIFLLKLNSSLEVTQSKQINGQGLDEGKAIYVNQHQIYLVCESDSNEQDFSFHTQSNRSVCVFLLEDTSLSILQKASLENNQNSDYLDSYFFDESLTILMEVRGTYGSFSHQGKYQGTLLVNFYQGLNSMNYFFLPEENTLLLEILTDSRQIYLFSTAIQDPTTLKIQSYEKEGRLVNENTLSFSNQNVLSVSGVVTSGEMIYFTLQKRKEDQIILDHYYSYLSNQIMTYSLDKEWKNSNSVNLSLFETSEGIEIVSLDHDIIQHYRRHVVSFESYTVKKEDQEDTFFTVFLDGKRISKDNETRVDTSTFGLNHYFVTYSLFSNVQLILKESYNIYLKVNVKEQETYDVGLVLSFNGTGYLNEIEIPSGYKVLSPGNYSLHLIGANHEEHTVNFFVKKISIEEQAKDEMYIEATEKERKAEHTSQVASVENQVLPYEEPPKTTGIILCLSIIIVCGILSFVYVRKEKKK